MSSAIEAAPGRIRVEPAAASAWRRDRRFFTGMALAAALAVFIGFAPTYYLKSAFATPALRWGGIFIIASQVVRLVLGGTPAWIAFANWLAR